MQLIYIYDHSVYLFLLLTRMSMFEGCIVDETFNRSDLGNKNTALNEFKDVTGEICYFIIEISNLKIILRHSRVFQFLGFFHGYRSCRLLMF